MKRLALCGLCAAMLLAGCGPTPTQLREQGITQFQLGRHAEAEKSLQQCLDRTPTDPRALLYMGRTVHARGQYEWAMFYYQRCLELDASFELARLWLDKAQTAAGPSGARMRFIP